MEPVVDSNSSLPRHDFYQTREKLILSIYLKAYNLSSIKEAIDVDFQPRSVIIHIPFPHAESSTQQKDRFEVGPLCADINPGESRILRVLTHKLEMELVKVEPCNWPTLFDCPDATAMTSPLPDPAYDNIHKPITLRLTTASDPEQGRKKNWDRMVMDEIDDSKSGDSGDPNGGGDSALQNLFSSIYKNADSDTRRAMNKSFTESGGTTLSTDWSNIGKEKTPIRPPEGMEARSYGE